jgi:hypothetical protein
MLNRRAALRCCGVKRGMASTMTAAKRSAIFPTVGRNGGVAREIYLAGDGTFEFRRTVSRLIEMQSEDYIANRPRR